jgi:hypothetical protein
MGDFSQLGDVIRQNDGYFSRGDALRCGQTDRDLRVAVREGQLVRLRQGMYARADEVDPDDVSAHHVLLARAVVAAQQGRVALTGPSAAMLHGLTVYGHDPRTVHLVRLDRGVGRRQAGVVHHVLSAIEPDVEEHSGLLTLNVCRTVWEAARVSSLEGGVCTADSALHRHPELIAPLAESADRYTHHPQSAKARLVLRLADGRAESAGESVTRVQFYRFGIPRPDLQVSVFGGHGELLGVPDFLWDHQRHLGEFDGKVKYEKFRRPGESVSDCVVREKRREDALRASFRGMTRFVWSSVMPGSARTTMSRLADDLEQSHRLYVLGRAS